MRSTIKAERVRPYLLFIWLLTQSGCIMISHPDYPADWPPVAKAQDWIPFQRTVPSDITYLINGFRLGSRKYEKDTVILRIEKDLTILLGFPDSLQPQKIIYRRYPVQETFDSVAIKKNRKGLLLRYFKDEGTDFMAVDFGRNDGQWSLLEDGSLMMKRSETLLGLAILIIPIYGSRHEWVRITKDSILVVK